VVTVLGRQIEDEEIPGDDPALVFLHEGLGSVGLWRGFPARVAEATGRRALIYSRFGHGASDPPPAPRTPAFMHEEAREVLPALFAAWDVQRPVLIGHSDGASIALIHAAEHPVAGVAVLAPHVFVEEVCLIEIRRAKVAYEQEGLRERMARRHADVDAAFYGWNDVWLDPDFPEWEIVDLLPSITAPVLALQGQDDQFGTLAQIDAVVAGVSGPAERVVVEARHAPHLEAPEATLDAVAGFVRAHG
jgi:pimeloyl-ACP methyl ester carboxylesterase